MQYFEAIREKKVGILKFNRGITNAINQGLVDELRQYLQEGRQNPDIKALILTSANDKFFSIGFDIPELFPLKTEEFRAFFRDFNLLCLELYTFPKPTLAALTGHAIAGGFILASCCDFRFQSHGKKFCALNEINLGVPVPFLADLVLRQLVGDRSASDIMFTGRLVQAEEARRMGFIDALGLPENLLQESLAKIWELGQLSGAAFGAIKENRTREIAEKARTYLEEDINLFLKFWYNEEARNKLQEAMKKF
jgi:enoyl-CoA hydratase/carnithine racemase